MVKKKVIEYEGKLYESYYTLFNALAKAHKLPEGAEEDFDDPELYQMERFIITKVMGLEVAEKEVH